MVRTEPRDGAANMALDVALLDCARRTGVGILRCYDWSRPTISFGRNESIVGRLTPDAISHAGFDAVRRPTGGRALLHASEVTYSVAMPLHADVPWRHAYDATNAILCAALTTMGIDAVVLNAGNGDQALRPSEGVCFAAPSPGEIAVGAAKLVGSAVWRDRTAYLQHGSIMLDDHQARLQSLFDSGPIELPRAATLRESAGRDIDWPDVATALEEAFSLTGDTMRWEIDDETQREAGLRVKQFEDPRWLWRC